MKNVNRLNLIVKSIGRFKCFKVLTVFSLLIGAQCADSQTIKTFAGKNALGPAYSGDGGPATNAALAYPTGISFGPQGNLLIADTGNSSIRYVSNGVINTIPGGTYAFSTLMGVVQDSSGTYYAASGDYGGLPEFKILPYVTAIGTPYQPALSVALGSSGNLYCVDEYGSTVSLRTPTNAANPNGTVTTIASCSAANFTPPGTWAFIFSSTTVDANSNLYIADLGNNVVSKVSRSGTGSIVAGNNGAGYSGDGGPAVNAQLSSPSAVAVDSAGNLYISDTGNNVIRKVDTSGKITTFAGTGTAGYSGDGGAAASATLSSPSGLAFDSVGNLFVSDTANSVIRKITFSSTITTSSSPAGDGSTSGGGTYNNGTSVTVTATPAAGYGFVNWTENGTVVSSTANYTFTAAGNRSLVANFVAQYTIVTTTSPAGGGTTSGGGTVNNGASVTVTATPAAGYTFVAWTVNDDEGMDDAWDSELEANGATLYYAGPQKVSTSASYTFNVTSNQTLIAHFSPGCSGTYNLSIGYYPLDTVEVLDDNQNIVWGPAQVGYVPANYLVTQSFTAVAGAHYTMIGHRDANQEGGTVDYYEEFFPFQVDATMDLTGPPYTEQDGSLCQ